MLSDDGARVAPWPIFEWLLIEDALGSLCTQTTTSRQELYRGLGDCHSGRHPPGRWTQRVIAYACFKSPSHLPAGFRFELPSAFGSASFASTFVKSMVVARAILAAAATAVSPIPAARSAGGGARDIVPLFTTRERCPFGRDLGFSRQRRSSSFVSQEGFRDQGPELACQGAGFHW